MRLAHTFLSTGATSFPTASEKKRDTKRNLQCTSVKYRLLGFGIDFIRHGVVGHVLVRRFFGSESVQEACPANGLPKCCEERPDE